MTLEWTTDPLGNAGLGVASVSLHHAHYWCLAKWVLGALWWQAGKRVALSWLGFSL